LHRQRWCQLRIERSALVKHEAIAAVMRTANFLEIFQNAAIELIHAVKADFLHVDRGFFAADAAGAKGHDGFAGQRIAVAGDDGGEVAELVDADEYERRFGWLWRGCAAC
jgi:hypothetical protein